MNFPCYESGQRIPVGTETDRTALAGTSGRVMAAKDIQVWNPGPYHVHICAGDEHVEADDTCAPVPAGALIWYGKGPATHLAAIAIDGPQEILVIVAEGS